MNKISMTEQQIAEIFAMNKVSQRQDAIDSLLSKYLRDISKKKTDLEILNNEINFYSSIMKNPKSYATWILNLTADLIFENSIRNNGVVKHDVNFSNNYTEFKFYIFNSKKRIDCDKEISLLISKNGIVADFDGDYASISRNRNNPQIWNARFPENLTEYLPLVDNKKNSKIKSKVKI